MKRLLQRITQMKDRVDTYALRRKGGRWMESNRREEQTQHERITDQILYEVKWLSDRWRPTNYLAIILVSIISSAITAWVITH